MVNPGSDDSPPLITESNTPPPYLSQATYDLLQNARNNTEKKYDGKTFCSETFRNAISTACVKTRGHVPYPWQLDATEATFLGLDSIVIAGTGAGKTLPFGLIHLVLPKLVTLVISPLNALEYDQVSETCTPSLCRTWHPDCSIGDPL
jgi:ATP-dependent helicase YprA (DUF1998 family)